MISTVNPQYIDSLNLKCCFVLKRHLLNTKRTRSKVNLELKQSFGLFLNNPSFISIFQHSAIVKFKASQHMRIYS
uniref:Putative ovule protein n=1 Tax=Solanum chacoense TaxID=4108 RepID=A0A0V0IRT8_SOLCH